MDMTNMPLPQAGTPNVLATSGAQTKELKNSASNSSKDGKNGSGKNFSDLFAEVSSGNVEEKKETDASASGNILAGLNAAYAIAGNLSQQIAVPELAQVEIEQAVAPSSTETVGAKFSEKLAQAFDMAAPNEANVGMDRSLIQKPIRTAPNVNAVPDVNTAQIELVTPETTKIAVSTQQQQEFFASAAMEEIVSIPKMNTVMEEPKSILTNPELLKQQNDVLQNQIFPTKGQKPSETAQPALFVPTIKESAVQPQTLRANGMSFHTQALPQKQQEIVPQTTSVSNVNPLGEVVVDVEASEIPQMNSLLRQLNAKTLRNIEKSNNVAQPTAEAEGQDVETVKPLVVQNGHLEVFDQSGKQEGSQNAKQDAIENLRKKEPQTIEPIEVEIEVQEATEPLPQGTITEMKSSAQSVPKQETFNLSDAVQNTTSAGMITGITQTRGDTTNVPTIHPNLHAAAEQAAKYDVPGQIVEQARLIKNGEDAQMVIKLKPDHLGDLTLKVTVENGAVNATFHSDNAQVRSMLEATLVQFKQDMANQGIKVDNVGVYAGLGQSLPDDRGEAGRQQQGSKYKNRKIAAAAFDEEGEKTSVPLNSNASSDGVDYRI